jgi:hypothetical protein
LTIKNDYQTGRSGAHARAFLEGWKGHLVVDDYAGYKALFAAGAVALCATRDLADRQQPG